MAASPRITVVTPNFNQGRFLETTIRSVLDQNYPNLEYIIVDGASTDGSVEIIRRYEPFLACWISEKDRGPADAINKGFSKATGSIFAYVNSDDIYMTGALARVAQAFESDRHADVVYGNTYWVDADDNVLAERRQTPFSRFGYFYGGADLQQPSTFWKRDLFERAGPLDVSMRAAFDTDLFFRFAKIGARFRFVNAFLSGFRIHPEQISDSFLTTARREVEAIRSRHLRFRAGSAPGIAFRNLARLQRLMWYLIQGDLPWLLGRLPDRARSKLHGEATGPRSKWI